MKTVKIIFAVILFSLYMAVPLSAASVEAADISGEETVNESAVYTEENSNETEEVQVTRGKRELSASVTASGENVKESSDPKTAVIVMSIAGIAVCIAAVVGAARVLKRSRHKHEAAIRSARRRDELLSGEDEVIKKYTIENDE